MFKEIKVYQEEIDSMTEREIGFDIDAERDALRHERPENPPRDLPALENEGDEPEMPDFAATVNI